eukprot:scaffold258469_cov40-Tisochrysis_lutea.AAC.1
MPHNSHADKMLNLEYEWVLYDDVGPGHSLGGSTPHHEHAAIVIAIAIATTIVEASMLLSLTQSPRVNIGCSFNEAA